MNREKVLKDIERTLFYNDLKVGMDELDKCRAAMAKLFVHDYDSGGIAAFRTLREAYTCFSGSKDIDGRFYPQNVSTGLRACMDFDSGSFAFALQNALSMYVSKMYKTFPFHEDKLISDKRSVNDFRKTHSVQLGYFGELPDVDPETGDYGSLASYDDTEAQYRIGQKGGIVWVTRTHIVNDSVELIQAMIKRMARAARLAHARYVWSFFINNATCPDGTDWFTLGHGNLASDALDLSPLVSGITALANMTEAGSGEKIGIDLETFKWYLAVPIDLWDTAVKKNQADSYFTVNDLTSKVPNPVRRLFGEKNERIISCPFFTDANDWGIIRDKEDVPIVEMSYLMGQEEPQFFMHEGPGDEQVFRRDRIGYKIRHEYGGTLADYKGGYKSIVP